MAAAEARATWQRTANHCFVQEDVKRGPKLSCCPSSSSSSKPESEGGPGGATNLPDHPSPCCLPHNWNLSNHDLPPDTKWWLHLQPNFVHQKDFGYEQLNALETELEVLSAEFVNQTGKFSADRQRVEECGIQTDTKNSAGPFLGQPWKVSATCMKNDQDTRMPELKAVTSNNPKKTPKNKDREEFWFPDDHLMDFDPFNFLVSEQSKKLSSDLESHWMGADKIEPWWRTADKDELASLVAQRSLEHIENCDLPRPQTKHFRREPSTCLECFDHDGILTSSFKRTTETGFSNLADTTQGSPTSVSMDENQCSLGHVGHRPHGSDRPFSSNNGYSTASNDQAEAQVVPESDPSKAQLLEALCHSQTRAREAEKAAQQTYTEKEHIIKLFFRQASQLFAYKQWFQLLQLEALCLQLKNKDQPISTLFPAVLPWVPYKGMQLRKGCHKASKRKRGAPRYEIGKCAVALAVGLSLAGAGLLLGWTTGWLIPAL